MYGVKEEKFLMREVYFFTSNRAKLAHLKHIGRKHGLDVNGFRELTYFGPYEEPRIRDREKLLRHFVKKYINY